MKILPWLAASALVLAARPAWPCMGVVDYTPTARPVAGDDTPGLQPWLVTRNLDPKNVTLVAATEVCPAGKRCEGMVVDVEVVDAYLRPAVPLPDGTHLQVIYGKDVLLDLTVRSAAPMRPVKLDVAGVLSMGVGDRAYVSMTLPLRDRRPETMIFVYATPPDPTRPFERVAVVREGDAETFEVALDRPRAGQPLQVWVATGDQDGHVSLPRKIL